MEAKSIASMYKKIHIVPHSIFLQGGNDELYNGCNAGMTFTFSSLKITHAKKVKEIFKLSKKSRT